MAMFRRRRRSPGSIPAPAVDGPTGPPRVLFLDDDPARAEVFLGANPQAVWVQTVGECLARLAENWDEVHLDHDLGGEVYVDMTRADCGMEVVRWLVLEPRPHLKATRFVVHSHNTVAAAMMSWQLLGAGFTAEARPFGRPARRTPRPCEEDAWSPEPLPRLTLRARLGALFRDRIAARHDDKRRGTRGTRRRRHEDDG